MAWYLKGFAVGGELRLAMASVSSLAELDDLLAKLDLGQPYPEAVIGQPRGRVSGARPVALPPGWLTDRGQPRRTVRRRARALRGLTE